MKTRPKSQNKNINDFINNASAEEKTALTTNTIQNRHTYEIEHFNIPFEDGSALRKQLNVSLKEFEWNTINSHIERIGASKAQWIKYACFKLMKEDLDE